MLAAIIYMMIDMMAAIARKDYQQRRERQAQGIAKAKAKGVYKGKPIDEGLHKRVRELLQAGLGIRATARHADCSTTTVMGVRDALPISLTRTTRRVEAGEPDFIAII